MKIKSSYLPVLFSFCLFSFLPISGFTQVYPYIFETQDKLLTKEYRLGFCRYEDDCRHEVVGDEQTVYLYRKYFCHSTNTDFQYVRIGQDSFYYSRFENDSLNQEIEKGTVVFKQQLMVVDTYPSDLETYEEILNFDTSYYLIRQKVGHWWERSHSDFSAGSYVNGVKDGLWSTSNDETRSWKKQIYSQGKLVEEKEQNLVLTDCSLAEMKHLFMNMDHFYQVLGKKDRYRFSRQPGRRVKFSENELIISGDHEPVKKEWHIDVEKKMFYLGDKPLQILWLTEDYIEIEKVKE